MLLRGFCVAGLLLVATSAVPAANGLNVKIGYLGTADKTETISGLIDRWLGGGGWLLWGRFL